MSVRLQNLFLNMYIIDIVNVSCVGSNKLLLLLNYIRIIFIDIVKVSYIGRKYFHHRYYESKLYRKYFQTLSVSNMKFSEGLVSRIIFIGPENVNQN